MDAKGSFVNCLERPCGNGSALHRYVSPAEVHPTVLLPFVDRVAQGTIGRQVLIGQLNSRCRACVMPGQPFLDCCTLVGVSIGSSDGVMYQLVSDCAEE